MNGRNEPGAILAALYRERQSRIPKDPRPDILISIGRSLQGKDRIETVDLQGHSLTFGKSKEPSDNSVTYYVESDGKSVFEVEYTSGKVIYSIYEQGTWEAALRMFEWALTYELPGQS